MFNMKKELRQIIKRVFRPGVCPKCGNTMSLLIAHYKACKISPRGWIQAIVDEQSKRTCVCPHCGYTEDMKITAKGLTPIDYDDEKDDRPKLFCNTDNPISDRNN